MHLYIQDGCGGGGGGGGSYGRSGPRDYQKGALVTTTTTLGRAKLAEPLSMPMECSGVLGHTQSSPVGGAGGVETLWIGKNFCMDAVTA